MKKENKKTSKVPEKKVEEKQKVNFEELIFANLSDCKLVYDNSGYQYTKLDLSNKNLESLSSIFNNYRYVEQIDLSGNNIIDFNYLCALPYLIRLNLEGNSVKDMKLLANEENFKNLRYLNLSKNKIIDFGALKIPNIQTLNLNDNKIEKFDGFDGHPKLKVLELMKNRISALTVFINLPELREIYLSENKIKNVQGIEALTNLQVLNLRKNIIEAFDETFPPMENLQYLNLRENKLEKFDEILKLTGLVQLRTLIYQQNNVTTKYPNYLLETVNNFLRLQRINKVYVTKSLKLKAFKYSEDKWKREQDHKAKAEEEERAREAALNQEA